MGAEESRDREGREAAVVSAGQTILGLDPGVRTGVAIYVLGRLQTLRTIPPDQIGHERDAAAVAWPYRSGWKR